MAPQGQPVRILVVDDDTMSRELLSVLLEAEGYAVEAADSGEAALAFLRRGDRAPDVVLTDMNMPGTTGARLAGKLRRACAPGTLLLAISGSQPPAKALARFDGFLLKPFKVEAIAAALPARAMPAPTLASAPGTASNQGMESSAKEQTSGAIDAGGSEAGPLLNQTIYQQLAGSMPPRQLREMYTLCVNDARQRIARMRSHMAAGDAASFVREAHAIKGGCGMLGATQLHGMAAELEKNGLASAGAGAAQEVNSLDELSAACDRLERMLRSRV